MEDINVYVLAHLEEDQYYDVEKGQPTEFLEGSCFFPTKELAESYQNQNLKGQPYKAIYVSITYFDEKQMDWQHEPMWKFQLDDLAQLMKEKNDKKGGTFNV